jgi:type II secretory pathway component PulK
LVLVVVVVLVLVVVLVVIVAVVPVILFSDIAQQSHQVCHRRAHAFPLATGRSS